MKQNRQRQLGNGAAPSWWGDQQAADPTGDRRERGKTPIQRGGRQPTGGLPSGADRSEPFTPTRTAATGGGYSPQWGSDTSPLRHTPLMVDRGGGVEYAAVPPPEQSAQDVHSATDETTTMLLELSRKLDETRLELRETEDRLLDADSALSRERNLHASEQESALQLLRQAQADLETEREARAKLEAELASARDSEGRWRSKAKKMEAGGNTRPDSGRGGGGGGGGGASRRPQSTRGGTAERSRDGEGDASRWAPRPPSNKNKDPHKQHGSRPDRGRPSPPTEPVDTDPYDASRHVHFDKQPGHSNNGGGHPRDMDAQLEAETASWGVDHQVIGAGSGADDHAQYEMPPSNVRTRPCPHCSRSFAEDRVSRHAKTCAKAKKSKRKPVDSAAMRTRGTEAEEFVRNAKRAEKKNRGKKPANTGVQQTGWREKSQAFREAMRASRS